VYRAGIGASRYGSLELIGDVFLLGRIHQ
jgi:hypothetical protein